MGLRTSAGLLFLPLTFGGGGGGGLLAFGGFPAVDPLWGLCGEVELLELNFEETCSCIT